MNSELRREPQQEIIADLCKNCNVQWVVDANVVIGGEAKQLLKKHANVWVTQQILTEVRSRPQCGHANKYINKIEGDNHVYDLDFSLSVKEYAGYKFLESCAKELSPPIRSIKREMIESGMPDTAETEIKAIEKAANHGSFFESALIKRMVGIGFISPDEGELDKATRRSWFKYPKKRRGKLVDGEYYYSDEILIATVIADSIFSGNKICILSNDNDLSAIMKQVADNWLWDASFMDVELSSGLATHQKVVALWESRCQDLNQHRESRSLEKIQRMSRAINAGKVDRISEFLVPNDHEILICRPSDGGLSSFMFSDPMVQFVRNYAWLKQRQRAIQKGIWLPG